MFPGIFDSGFIDLDAVVDDQLGGQLGVDGGGVTAEGSHGVGDQVQPRRRARSVTARASTGTPSTTGRAPRQVEVLPEGEELLVMKEDDVMAVIED